MVGIRREVKGVVLFDKNMVGGVLDCEVGDVSVDGSVWGGVVNEWDFEWIGYFGNWIVW